MKFRYHKEDVARGATLLDIHRPGWAATIDLDALNMFNVKKCILGQVFGDYIEGMKYFGHTLSEPNSAYEEFSQRHGFDGGHALDDGVRSGQNILRDAWKDVIKFRLGVANLSSYVNVPVANLPVANLPVQSDKNYVIEFKLLEFPANLTVPEKNKNVVLTQLLDKGFDITSVSLAE